MERVTLNNGVEIPLVGLGTFLAKGSEVYEGVKHALKVGYRHIDTAAIYGNEEEVGKAIRDGGIPREEIFVTTKIWNSEQGYESAKKAFALSKERLGIGTIDLCLIHWYKGKEKARETWRALEELYEAKEIRSIGVSNFAIHHLRDLLEVAKIKPVVNQVELHVGLPQYDLQDFCQENEIYLESYGPLQKGQIFKHAILEEIAKKHNRSVANIAVRFLMDRKIIALPKSIDFKRIEDNFNLFDFHLDDEDLEKIRTLWDGKRIYSDPDNCAF